jgi:hypothetical protein
MSPVNFVKSYFYYNFIDDLELSLSEELPEQDGGDS